MKEFETEVENLINLISSYAIDSTGGITRLLYSPEWKKTQEELKKVMQGKLFDTYYDEVGNLFGRLKGENEEKTILVGSHIDTVKNGGKYDGQFGIIAGVIAIEYLRNKFGKPKKNLEVVSFAEEEGSRFNYVFWGSKNLLGIANKEDVLGLFDSNEICFIDAMKDCGFDINKKVRKRNDLEKFIELHIEQGNVLENEKKEIGVVNCITGQKRISVKIKGLANHAGTTPMQYRQDALFISSEIIYKLISRANEFGSPMVATVGHVEVLPNVVNVVPSEVTFSIDIRHTNNDDLDKFYVFIEKTIEEISSKNNGTYKIDKWMDVLPVYLDNDIAKKIENICMENNFSYKVMHSGAGHDSQLIAKYIPTGLIFVPSHKGISHNPEEYTEPELLAKGIKVLIDTLYKLAY